jgi:ethanolamine utilization protein EutA
MAKALGQQLGLLLPGREVLCIDGVKLEDGSYLDVGAPVGTALPVVVKTLILER